nr:hypothetical protein [Tanacetum cinerariifolium]
MDMRGYEVSHVLVTCRSAESRRNVPEWLLRIENDRVAWNKYTWGSYVWPTLYSQLRNVNVRRWGPLYVDQPTNEDDPTTYSIFGYTWAFKTWILESFRVTAIWYFDRFNRYPRVAAWSKKKGRFLAEMVILFFEFVEQKLKLERNRKDVDEIKEQMLKFKEEMNARPVRQENTVPINVGQHYRFSDFSQFQSMHMPEQSTNQYWQPSPQPGSYYSFGKVPSHIGRPNLQTTIETQHDVDGLVDQRVSKTKKKGKKANLSPVNLGGVLEGYNEEDNNVIFLRSQYSGNILFYENVDPAKVFLPIHVAGNH